MYLKSTTTSGFNIHEYNKFINVILGVMLGDCIILDLS